ncbi:hypothetical protein BGZ93_010970 [Podila epicladia]|nr:hypothetical protein BGZ93_010970 [Podila epicladia]
MVLTYLPTYLCELYPINCKFLAWNEHPFSISTQFIKTTGLSPGNTGTYDILRAIGVPFAEMNFTKPSELIAISRRVIVHSFIGISESFDCKQLTSTALEAMCPRRPARCAALTGPYQRALEHTEAERGFTSNNTQNLVEFLLGGTLLNNGTLIVRDSWLVAEVSDLVVGLLFGASLAVVLAALVISYGIPSLVRDPISDVLQQVMASKIIFVGSRGSMYSPRTRRTANLVLDIQRKEDVADNIDADLQQHLLRQ